MSKRCCLAAGMIAYFALVSCSPPLPKAYGVYARDGRKMIDLTDSDATNDWSLPPDVAIIVFERELAEPMFTPAQHLLLQQTAYARSEQLTELRLDARSAQELINRGPEAVHLEEIAALPVRKRSAASKGSWITFGGPISVRYEPVEDRHDIIVVVPASPLRRGTYVLTRQSATGTRRVTFAVDLSSDIRQREQATCVDEYLYTARRPEGFQGWNQWFTDISNMERERGRRMAGGNPVLEASSRPCSALDEQAKARLRLPPYLQNGDGATLKAWLVTQPNLRVAEPADCKCDQDLVAIRQSWKNPQPYYVQADFNNDGQQDFAVVLLESAFDHQWGWNADLAVFNGPLREGMSPSFFKEQIGAPRGALLYHSDEVPLLIGPWESEGSVLKAKGATYSLQ